jgi:chromosome segregation ATPase
VSNRGASHGGGLLLRNSQTCFRKDDVSRLEEEVKNLKAESATLKSSLKRESLRFDGIKNEKDELENANAELKRSNTDLKRQVDKWQSLENKEGTETEKLRKERISLKSSFERWKLDSPRGNSTLQRSWNSKMRRWKSSVPAFGTMSCVSISGPVFPHCPSSGRVLSRMPTRNPGSSLHSSNRRARSSNRR